MQSQGSRRQLFTSLVGVTPLRDILEDLPLPSAVLTPTEKHVMGTKGISAETRRLLNDSDVSVCSKITEALLMVDTSFLDLKERLQAVPMSPSFKAPPLIQAVMSGRFLQPSLKLNKVDPLVVYQSPEKFSNESAYFHGNQRKSVDTVVHVQERVHSSNVQPEKSATKKKVAKKHSSIVEKKVSRRKRQISSSNSDSDQVVRHVKRKRATSSEAEVLNLTVSIPRVMQKQSLSHRQITPLKNLTVRVPRAKLPIRKESTYSPQSHPYGPGSTDAITHGPVSTQFFMDRYEQVVPIKKLKSHHHKVKKSHSRPKYDSNQALKINKFVSFVESTFDMLVAKDELLTSNALSRLLSEVSSMKQHGILHEVPMERLVQLIERMDAHVLDSVHLQIDVSPDNIDSDVRAWREHSRDRILRSADAANVILHITTTPNVPKNVLVEESIEQVISLTKYHLENNVYPQFDAIYKAENKETVLAPSKKRRAGGGQTTNKVTMTVYHKLTEVLGNIAMLVETQSLTDMTILNLSTLGIVPFFVENINLLQLSALRVIRAIFSRYEKHRDLIIEEIFASLRKLPTSKRNLRSFKLSNGQTIQMVTALVLQLIQCIIVLPKSKTTEEEPKAKIEQDDIDMLVTKGYDLALSIGNKFLSNFLKRCCSGKDEEDFRPLFENFVQDLLSTLNLAEWPSSEVLLTLLGMLLVRSFGNRSNEQSLRLTSIDHLGIIAARLRKDVVTSTEKDQEEQIEILAQVIQCKADRITTSPTGIRMDAFTENMHHFMRVLMAYLNKRSGVDSSYAYARDFYIAQWIYDTQVEFQKALKESNDPPSVGLDPITMGIHELDVHDVGISSSALSVQHSEIKMDMLHSLLDHQTCISLKPLEGILDDKKATVVARSLASSRTLSKSFDMYLQNLIRVLNEPAVHVRTRAMKSLSVIVAVDPGILSRSEMQRAVEFRFTDQSTLVREAAVDFVGRFILNRPELTLQYYVMLCQRIRDSGVSVRKRVIKILKDICVLQPDFPKINDICMIILRRIQIDEESVKQMVIGVFRELWFTPPSDSLEDIESVLLKRVTNITSVVGMCNEHEWFEQLLRPMLKTVDQSAVDSVMGVCQMMVDCLVQKVIAQDESASGKEKGAGLVPCMITLYLFSSVRPTFLLNHVSTLHPYLSSNAETQKDVFVLHYVAQIFKDVVPLMEHPSESFLAVLEGNLVKVIMNYGQLLIHSGVECLGAIVNKVTHNYGLMNDCFLRFTKCLEQMRALHTANPSDQRLKTHRASLLRSVYTVGVICKFFNMECIPLKAGQARPTTQQVYSLLFYFIKNGDNELQIKTIKGFGLFTARYPDLMLELEAKQLYFDWLSEEYEPAKKIEILRNIHNYLKEVESKLQIADHQVSSTSGKTDLLEFGDSHSSISSNVAQTFLVPILEALLHGDMQVRNGALLAVVQILHQGLVHPNQCVPYLIAISTDSEVMTKGKADQELVEHSQRYGHFMQTQLLSGVKKSYILQKVLAGEVPRGFSTDNVGTHMGLLNHVYSLIRSSKQHRRTFLRALLRYFEDYEKSCIGFLLYLADNLAYFPYNTLEEPLFVVHHIDMTVSVTGSSLLQQFREVLGTSTAINANESDDEEKFIALEREACDLKQLSECCHSIQGCFLLLLLKQHLKKCYGLTDSKCQKYSPTESNKAYEKAVSRRTGITFDPKQVLEQVKSEFLGERKILRSREEYVQQYVEFKDLMNKLDPFDEVEEGSDQEGLIGNCPPIAVTEGGQQDLGNKEKKDQNLVKIDDNIIGTVQVSKTHTMSRRSSVSSVTSTGSHLSRGRRSSTSERKVKPKKRKKVIISSDDSDDG